MKTKKLQICILLMLLTSFMGYSAQAQTSISINSATDTTWTSSSPCTFPYYTDYVLWGNCSGYTTADTILIYIAFGDGTDTSFYTPIYGTSILYFGGEVTHAYNFPGTYSVQYIATGPDGNADTLVHFNEIILGNCQNVSGKVYVDNNGDCIFNAGDVPLSNFAVWLMSNPHNYVTSTDINGDYSYGVPTGTTYTVGPNNYGISQSGFQYICPSSGTYTVSALPSNNNDFALSCSQSTFDLTAWQYHGWNLRPAGLPGRYQLNVANISCFPVNATIKLALDPTLTYDSSQVQPDAISGDTLIWNVSTLNTYTSGFYTWVYIKTAANSQIGDIICTKLIMEPIAGDANPGDNILNYCKTLTAAYDPNSKEAWSQDITASGHIYPGREIQYTVHFQNTGTAAAENVFVLDTLDANLDLNTFHFNGASHSYSYLILPGRVLKVDFNNIQLPDSGTNFEASQGYFSYSIKSLSSLTNGTHIINTAHIYFDFNPAVATNTTDNIIDQSLGIETNNFNSNADISFANPVADLLQLTGTAEIINARYEITDVSGRTCLAGKMDVNRIINVAHLRDLEFIFSKYICPKVPLPGNS